MGATSVAVGAEALPQFWLFSQNTHELAIFRTFLFEFDVAVFFRKESMIPPDTDIGSCMEARTALAHDNTPGKDFLAAEFLDAQTLGF